MGDRDDEASNPRVAQPYNNSCPTSAHILTHVCLTFESTASDIKIFNFRAFMTQKHRKIIAGMCVCVCVCGGALLMTQARQDSSFATRRASFNATDPRFKTLRETPGEVSRNIHPKRVGSQAALALYLYGGFGSNIRSLNIWRYHNI